MSGRSAAAWENTDAHYYFGAWLEKLSRDAELLARPRAVLGHNGLLGATIGHKGLRCQGKTRKGCRQEKLFFKPLMFRETIESPNAGFRRRVILQWLILVEPLAGEMLKLMGVPDSRNSPGSECVRINPLTNPQDVIAVSGCPAIEMRVVRQCSCLRRREHLEKLEGTDCAFAHNFTGLLYSSARRTF